MHIVWDGNKWNLSHPLLHKWLFKYQYVPGIVLVIGKKEINDTSSKMDSVT